MNVLFPSLAIKRSWPNDSRSMIGMASNSGYSESDDEEEEDCTASFHRRTIMHLNFVYDGKGLHPSILTGFRIQGFIYGSEKGLQLHCERGCFNLTFCGWPSPTSVGLNAMQFLCHRSCRNRLDKILQNGLRSTQELDEQGLNKRTGLDQGKVQAIYLLSELCLRRGKGSEVTIVCLGCSATG